MLCYKDEILNRTAPWLRSSQQGHIERGRRSSLHRWDNFSYSVCHISHCCIAGLQWCPQFLLCILMMRRYTCLEVGDPVLHARPTEDCQIDLSPLMVIIQFLNLSVRNRSQALSILSHVWDDHIKLILRFQTSSDTVMVGLSKLPCRCSLRRLLACFMIWFRHCLLSVNDKDAQYSGIAWQKYGGIQAFLCS